MFGYLLDCLTGGIKAWISGSLIETTLKLGKGVSSIFFVEDILTQILDTIFRERYLLLLP